GVVVSVFRYLIELLVDVMPKIYTLLREHPIWIPVWFIILMSAAFFISYLVKKEPNIKGGGTPEIQGQLNGSIELNWWSVLWKKFVAGILSIGSGLALGREGPSIQLGAVVGQGVNDMLKGNKNQKNILISSGASAGLSAAFNAPMSGLTFILEEVH